MCYITTVGLYAKLTATEASFLPNAQYKTDCLTPDSPQTKTLSNPTIASFTFLATRVATVITLNFSAFHIQLETLQVYHQDSSHR
jgi:hypothetical protein